MPPASVYARKRAEVKADVDEGTFWGVSGNGGGGGSGGGGGGDGGGGGSTSIRKKSKSRGKCVAETQAEFAAALQANYT